jgi:TonB family protein
MLTPIVRLIFIALLMVYSAASVGASGVTGNCVVLLDLDNATGKVLHVQMIESTGSHVLDESAIKAFQKWRFKPHTRSPVKVPMKFGLSGDGGTH